MALTNIKHSLVQWLLSLPVKGSGIIGMRTAALLFPRISGNRNIPTLYGFDIVMHGAEDKIIERTVYYTGTYEKGTVHMLGLLLAEGDVFVDAGANIGLMSLVASGKIGERGKVYAFEPFSLMYERLLANILLNKRSNIITFPNALAAQSGEALLYINTHHNPGASSLVHGEASGKGVTVLKQTLDSMITPDTNVNVLKVDVEGYEMEVLKGARRILSEESAPAIIVECSADRQNYGYEARDLFQFILTINRYRIYKLKRGKGHISPLIEVTSEAELPQHDNLFCLLPHHVKKVFNDQAR